MGANKNIYNPNNHTHGHFCQRCKYHYLCSKLYPCHVKVKGDEFAPFYFETRPELVDVETCEFCKDLSDETCAGIKQIVASYHFGNKDKRLSKFGLYSPDF